MKKLVTNIVSPGEALHTALKGVLNKKKNEVGRIIGITVIYAASNVL